MSETTSMTQTAFAWWACRSSSPTPRAKSCRSRAGARPLRADGARFAKSATSFMRRFAEGGRLSPLFDLGGRIVVVTGGLGRLGRGFARRLVEHNARVAVFDVVGGGEAAERFGVAAE